MKLPIVFKFLSSFILMYRKISTTNRAILTRYSLREKGVQLIYGPEVI